MRPLGGHSVVRNGHKHGKQAYLCRNCGKSFVETTNTAMCRSHYGKDVWEQVTKGTYERKAIDRTAERLGLDHHAVFNMRRKILKALEDTEEEGPIELGEVSELDETFVLESNHINKFHAFIKSCRRNFRGVATKHLNRYNALFSSAYQQCEAHARRLFEIISQCSPFQRHYSNYDVRNHNLLLLLS